MSDPLRDDLNKIAKIYAMVEDGRATLVATSAVNAKATEVDRADHMYHISTQAMVQVNEPSTIESLTYIVEREDNANF